MAPNISVISVFHQLHHLYTIRPAFYAEQADQSEDLDLGHSRKRHAGHCFEYLRQSILCAADSSIEPAAAKQRDDHEFLGWNVARQCRDYEQLKRRAEERRAFDAHGFLAKDLEDAEETD